MTKLELERRGKMGGKGIKEEDGNAPSNAPHC